MQTRHSVITLLAKTPGAVDLVHVLMACSTPLQTRSRSKREAQQEAHQEPKSIRWKMRAETLQSEVSTEEDGSFRGTLWV